MSLVTWQAIGAVVLIVALILAVALFAHVALQASRNNKDNVSGCGCAISIFLILILGFVIALTWQTIGVGLFGATP